MNKVTRDIQLGHWIAFTATYGGDNQIWIEISLTLTLNNL